MANTARISDIKEFIPVLREYFAHHVAFQKKYLSARHIHSPKTPSFLSESIVLDLIENGRVLKELRISDARLGGAKADILAIADGNELRIEVKATGKSAFQYFGQKDINCDYLVWLHFNDFFTATDYPPVELYILKDPGRIYKKPRKITLNEFKKSGPTQSVIHIDKNYGFTS